MSLALNNIRNRPRFKIQTELSPTQFCANLKKRIDGYDTFSGSVNNQVATIYVETTHNHFWKPQLALRTEINEEENITEIRGVFGPSSAVWTFFMFMYMIFSIGFMVFISFYFVAKQIKSEEYNWSIYAAFMMLGLLAIVYIAAIIGKRLAKREMDLLRTFAENTIIPYEKYDINDP